VEVQLHALDGDEWSASRSDRLTAKESAPETHCIRGWVGPRAGLDVLQRREKTFIALAGI
jgi:hypothetical protein